MKSTNYLTKKTFLFFTLVIFLFSCEKEGFEKIEKNNHDTTKIELRNTNSDSYYAKDFQSPSNELLSEVLDLMVAQNWWSDLATYIESNNYSIRGNLATIEKMDSGEYALFIPVKDENNQLVSLIKYSTAGDHAHFTHKSVRKIMLIAEEDNITDIPDEYISFIIKLASYQHYLYDGASTALISALGKYIEANPDKIHTRQTTESYTVVFHTSSSGSDDIIVREVQVISDCNAPSFDGSPGGGGSIIDDIEDLYGGGSIAPTKAPLKNILDKYPSLTEFVNCLEEYASSSAMGTLLNNAEALECLAVSEEELYDIIKDLCEQSSGGPSLSGIEGNHTAGASPEFNNFDDMLPDYINPSESWRDCEQVNCIYNNILSSNSSYICEVVGEIFNSDDFELVLSVGELVNYGSTEYDADTKKATLTIDEFYCGDEASHIHAARLMLHEFTHAKWMQDLVGNGNNPNELEGYAQIWSAYEEYLKSVYENNGGAEGVQHAIMIHIEDTIKNIAKTLADLVGDSNLTWENFMCEASSGLTGYMTTNYYNQFQDEWSDGCQGVRDILDSFEFTCP